MRYSIFIMLVVLGWVCLGQSKKEQIRVLSNRVDSLNLVLNSERTDYSQRVEQLNGRISELEEKVRGLEIKLKEKDSENEINKKQIDELRKLINVKSDSIRVLKAEVEKLKPTPKPVVPTNPIVATPSGPYKTVTIGTQVWMKENLNVSTFRNGDPIPEAKTDEEWKAAGDAKQPAWCYYDNDPNNGAKYGKLYNWYAVNDSRGLAPEGWHVPTDQEWTDLIGFLGDDAGKKMKSKSVFETKTTYYYEGGYDETIWVKCNNCDVASPEYKKICPKCKGTGGKMTKTGRYIPKTKKKYEEKIQIDGWDGTDESGFSSLAGGCRNSYGEFTDIKENAYMWSSTDALEECNKWNSLSRLIYGNYNSVSRKCQVKTDGLTIRCIRSRIVFGQDGNLEVNNASFGSGHSGSGDDFDSGISVLDRIQINDPILPTYNTDVDLKVHLKLTVDGEGNVLSAICIKSKTTTTDQTIINDVIREVKKQVKYKKDPEGKLAYCYLTVKINAK